MNYSPRNFHDPNSFHPERCLPLNASSPFANDDRAAFQPFFIGPRNCIGRNLAYTKMRIILARVLWKFDLELTDGSFWDKMEIMTTKAENPLLCRLKVREGL